MRVDSKSSSLASHSWELFVTTLAQSVALGGMIVASVFIGAVVGTSVGVKCARGADGRNLVMIPVYQEPKDGSDEAPDTAAAEASAKVQYPSQNDELPIVHSKEAAADTRQGVGLPAGPEVVIDPDGGVAVLNEPVVEKIEEAPADATHSGREAQSTPGASSTSSAAHE